MGDTSMIGERSNPSADYTDVIWDLMHLKSKQLP